MTPDQQAKVRRVLVNAGIMAIAAGSTVFLQELQSADFGNWTALIMLFIGTGIKAIQAFVQPSQDIYK